MEIEILVAVAFFMAGGLFVIIPCEKSGRMEAKDAKDRYDFVIRRLAAVSDELDLAHRKLRRLRQIVRKGDWWRLK